MYYVYIMRDPDTKEPFYVGKGSGNRMMIHEQKYLDEKIGKQNLTKTAKIASIKEAGKFIIYEQIPCESETIALNMERDLITEFGTIRKGTGPLTNLAAGGASGRTTSPVYQYTLGGEFVAEYDGTIEAAKSVNGNKSSVQNAANPKTKQKSAHGFLWSYVKMDKLEAWTHNLIKAVTQHDKQGNLIAEFASIADASKATGIDQGNISACCSGTLKTAGGFVWKT